MSSTMLERLAGPRVPDEDLRRGSLRFAAPGLLLLVARVLILVSLFFPYWHMVLEAPQYPSDLHLHAFVNSLTGDVAEIDGLNHYIGMRPLDEAAQLERRFGVFVLIAMAVLLELAAFVHNRWAALLALPAVLFPAVFLLDLHFWLSHFGRNLDPDAPLSSAIDPFVPPVLGVGTVGQFRTVATPGAGLALSAGASAVILVALWFHRRAYRPLHGRTAPAGAA